MGRIIQMWRLLTEVGQCHKECIEAGKPLDTPYFELGKTDVDGKAVTILSVHPVFMNHQEALGGLLSVSPEDQVPRQVKQKRQVHSETDDPRSTIGASGRGIHKTGQRW